MILFKQTNLFKPLITYKEKQKENIIEQNINNLKQDPKTLAKAKEDYLLSAINRPVVDANSPQEDFEDKAV